MFRPVLLVALAAVVAASRSSPVYQKSYFNLKPVLSGWGLPPLYSPRYSLRGLERYLHQAKVSPKLFVRRIKQYEPVIRSILSKQKQYSGIGRDLFQMSVLRYYGCRPVINPKISIATYFSNYMRMAKLPSLKRYNAKYVQYFLNGFKGYLRKNMSQKIVIPIVLPKPSYPGYELLTVLKNIHLPALGYPKKSLGGIIEYLKVVKISQKRFIRRIQKHRRAILKLVRQYQKQYSGGYRSDLLKLAVLRYYGIQRTYSVKFSAAFKQALTYRYKYKYSESYVKSFLVRFSKYLVKRVYPGYELKALLTKAKLPKLAMPQYSLPGLVAYLRSNKYKQAALVKRIEKYARKIRATVYRYKKQYSGYRADLLQLCAIRYYSMPSIIRRNVRFGYTFQSYIRSQKSRPYNALYVSKFLNGFVKYIRHYQLKKYRGALW